MFRGDLCLDVYVDIDLLFSFVPAGKKLDLLKKGKIVINQRSVRKFNR